MLHGHCLPSDPKPGHQPQPPATDVPLGSSFVLPLGQPFARFALTGAPCLPHLTTVSSLPSVTWVGQESTLAEPEACLVASLSPLLSGPPLGPQQGSWSSPSNVTSGPFCTVTTARLRPLEETRGPEKEGVAQGGTASCLSFLSSARCNMEVVIDVTV